jgi:hypothetical protein
VPSVPETQFRRGVVLTGVPNDARYRVLLRVYGYPGSYPVAVRLRDDATGEFLTRQDLTLSGSDMSYLQLPITADPTSKSVRVEVTATQPSDPPIWAFITLTNNTTENVTIITPNVVIAPEVPSTTLAEGHWAHAGYCMNVDQSQFVVATYGCARGSFSVPKVDPDGHFDTEGELNLGGAFPKTASAGGSPFAGFVNGGNLALTMGQPRNALGPVNLIHGSTEPCFLFACP